MKSVELSEKTKVENPLVITLCSYINCDKGKVITDKVTCNGMFFLKDCPKCEGRGYIIENLYESKDLNE